MGLLGGGAAWPFAARAQTTARHIGLLMPMAEDDPEGCASATEFERGLAERGWTGGHNVRIVYRWAIDSPDKIDAAIAEFQAPSPDVILVGTSRSVAALRQAMPTTPIVCTMIYEPVAQGFVKSLARPGGNVAGFTAIEASIGAKWLELLWEMGPRLARVAYLCNPNNPGAVQPYAAVEAAARKHAVAVTLAGVQDSDGIEAAIEPGGGLIAPPDGFLVNHRRLTHGEFDLDRASINTTCIDGFARNLLAKISTAAIATRSLARGDRMMGSPQRRSVPSYLAAAYPPNAPCVFT